MPSEFEFFPGDPKVDGASLSPAHIKEHIRALDPSNRDRIDLLLFGKPCTEIEKELFEPDDYETVLSERYPGEQPWKGNAQIIWTPYEKIKTFLDVLDLSSKPTLYDLGAGYGRVPLYAGITTEATCKGIELVSERAERAQAAKKRLELNNVTIINANVLDVDFSDGDIFYLYSPFSPKTFKQVLVRLQELAAQKPVTIVARLNVPAAVSLQGFTLKDSLNPYPLGYFNRDIVIYKSNSHPPAKQSER